MRKVSRFLFVLTAVVSLAGSIASISSADTRLVAPPPTPTVTVPPPPVIGTSPLKELVCRGASGYSQRLSVAAAQSLLKAGYKNFKVQVSSVGAGRDPRIELPDLFTAASFNIKSELIGCDNQNGSTGCKVGARATFVGALPKDLIPCDIFKTFTIKVTLGGDRTIVTTQTLTVPGAYVHPVFQGRDTSNQSVK